MATREIFASNTSAEGTCVDSSFERIHSHYEKTCCSNSSASRDRNVPVVLHHGRERAGHDDHDYDA
jgi:hypothetical protein